jgi:hypothetical protein
MSIHGQGRGGYVRVVLCADDSRVYTDLSVRHAETRYERTLSFAKPRRKTTRPGPAHECPVHCPPEGIEKLMTPNMR